VKNLIAVAIITLAIGLLPAHSAYAMESIQTQPSSDGNFEASLIGVKIRDEILTLKVMLKNVGSKKKGISIEFAEVYYTDVKDKKKYFVLKDSEGIYIAGPQYGKSGGGYFKSYIKAGSQAIVWIKMPAPPATTETIDLFLPGFLPLEEVAITR